jgi:HK97 gp10 family phage protein
MTMAVEVSCTVKGIRAFQSAMRNFDEAIKRQVHRQLASWAADVKAEAMRKVPVKTGHLRSSIYAKVSGWVVQIGAEAAYALFVELGTRKMQARPYLYPAIKEYLPQLEQMIREAIDAAKAEAGFR